MPRGKKFEPRQYVARPGQTPDPLQRFFPNQVRRNPSVQLFAAILASEVAVGPQRSRRFQSRIFPRRSDAIVQLVPPHFKDGVNLMSVQMPSKRRRCPLVKENLHADICSSRLAAANSSTASTCFRVTPGNHSTNSSMVAPSSRFSKSARTGTRVLAKTQAPLSLAGSRSTAVH